MLSIKSAEVTVIMAEMKTSTTTTSLIIAVYTSWWRMSHTHYDKAITRKRNTRLLRLIYTSKSFVV